MIKVTVIVPTYNQCDYLSICLDSLLFQRSSQTEILIVNDGSTDDTEYVLDEYLRSIETEKVQYVTSYDEENENIIRSTVPRYPNNKIIRVVVHETNKGLAHALNTGVREAAGEYVTYVPSDNYCYPGMLENLSAALDAGADFAYSDMLIVDDEGHIIRDFALPDYSFQSCFGMWYFCGVSKLYRKNLHEQFGLYDENLLAHDHDLFQRFALGGASFVHISKPLMAVRDHGEVRRQIDIHSPDNWSRLLRESCELVKQAHKALKH